MTLKVYGIGSRDCAQLFPELQEWVYDMIFTDLPDLSEFGIVFALQSSGIGYYNSDGELETYSIVTNGGAKSVAYDDENERIIAALIAGNSDGLYSFDPVTHQFSLLGYYDCPHFVKKLGSTYYFAHGFYENDSRLYFSEDGAEWIEMPEFHGIYVNDIEMGSDGRLFVGTGDSCSSVNRLYMQAGDEWVYDDILIPVMDLHFRSYPDNNELYVLCSNYSNSDAVYRVEYSDTEVTINPLLNWFRNANCLYEYEDYLVVGCVNGGGLYLTEMEVMGNYFLIEEEEADFVEVYCFEYYPMYTPNFLAGTNNGVYLFTNFTEKEECEIEPFDSECFCYPNPFNPSTSISFSIPEKSAVEVNIYNIQGQKVKKLIADEMNRGEHSIIWSGENDLGKKVSSGIYYYQLSVNGKIEKVRRCLLLK